MRVLVTGHRGYIGSVLTCVLRHLHFEVVGLDSDLFAGCDFGRTDETIPSYGLDIRDTQVTEEVNIEATLRLAQCCKEAGVSRFLFASTCGVYGAGNGAELDERGATRPLTEYALSKLICEQELARLADVDFTPVFLRSGTAYGVSPRLRLDTVVNDFVASAAATSRVTMRSAGHAWRPLVHVEDLAKAFAAVLLTPDEKVRCQAFNVVRPGENYRVIDIADEVIGLVPFCVREQPESGTDRRSYRADGSKLERTCPNLKMRWTLPLGVRQLYNAMTHAGMSLGDWRSDRHRRALHLKALIERGDVDATLRPTGLLQT
jgi:nucleoside-diphosphate-sugar epimerase